MKIKLETDPALTETWCLQIGRLYVFWRSGLHFFIYRGEK
jgi:hypothetical protein